MLYMLHLSTVEILALKRFPISEMTMTRFYRSHIASGDSTRGIIEHQSSK